MNPLVKKEIRLLLPGFLIGVALTFVNGFLKVDQFEFNVFISVLSIASCSAIAVFVALNSFGAEISSGTFSMLLAQPVSRHRIWRTKTLLLAAALFIGGFLWCAILCLRFMVIKHPTVLGNFGNIFLGTWLFLPVIYSGALWTVLLLRQMAAAFWFTLLTPGAIVMLIAGLWPEKYSAAGELVVIAALLVYSLAGFWFARWLFLRAQDAQWTGGNIAWPEMRGLKWWGKRSSGRSLTKADPSEPQATFDIGSSVASLHRTWRPKAALFAKEIQLHQSQLVIASVLVLLHIAAIAMRKFGHFPQSSSLEFVLEAFWTLWLVMPLLVGCAAVAEERKIGTLEGQLCLPVKYRRQFAVKLFVVLLLSILFGTVMPLLLEGNKILPGAHLNIYAAFERSVPLPMSIFWQTAGYLLLDFLNLVSVWMPVLILAGISTGFAALSFYASTLARNTLQALAPAVLGILTTCFLFTAGYLPEVLIGYPLWRGPLVYPIGLPVMVFVLTGLAFWNFKRVLVGWSVWRRNLLTLVISLALVIMATTAFYHRAWEKLTPFEPPHGAARLSLSNPATLSEQWNVFFVRLPDGRIWTDTYGLNNSAPTLALFMGDIRLASLGRDGHFLDGSNWVSVVCGMSSELTGIKTDGTLWVSEKPARLERMARGGWRMTKAGELVRFGSETNWSSIVHQQDFSMLLVKNDGTLWHWGILTNWNWKTKWPGLQSFTPYRLGTESNWAEIFLADHELCLRKTDGSIWTRWYTHMDNEKQTIKLEPGFSMQRSALADHGKWLTTATTLVGLGFRLCVCENGTFRICADQKLNEQSHAYDWTPVNLQLGKDTNWLGMAGRDQKIVTLKNDGTLWLWAFHHDNWRAWNPELDEREMLEAIPVRLGTHSDWIGVASTDGGIISLAADGSLWYWPLESAGYFSDTVNRRFLDNGHSHFEPLFDISRKPEFLANIFGKSD